VNYQRQLEDAQEQYNKQLIQVQQNLDKQRARAKQSEDQQLADAANALTTQLSVRRQAHTAELQMLSLTVQERARIEQEGQAQLLRQAAAFYPALARVAGLSQASAGTSGGGGSTGRASGGYLGAGQSANVNESFTNGRTGKTTILPGAGLFTPFEGGTVNKGGGINVNMPFTINGATDPDKVAAAVRRVAVQTLQEILA
jgi:hypothetical protein